MAEQGSGCILAITSGGCFIPSPRSAPYTASKAAILSFTLCVAAELEPFGVTVNALSPGLTATRLGEGAIVDITDSFDMSREEFYAEVGAPQSPDALAPLAIFLASPEGTRRAVGRASRPPAAGRSRRSSSPSRGDSTTERPPDRDASRVVIGLSMSTLLAGAFAKARGPPGRIARMRSMTRSRCFSSLRSDTTPAGARP
jgi:hypothetical protein